LSKKASKTVIGSFVVGAIALVVMGVMVFGSGEFLKEKFKFVLFFQDSVKGLRVGAPVVFLGVEIGQVKDITVLSDSTASSFQIQVIIEVGSGKLKGYKTAKLNSVRNIDKFTDQLISHGLRAQLGLQSIVTGQLQIELDFHPEEDARLLGMNAEYHEIPTVPSTIEKFTKVLEKLPIEEIVNKLLSTLSRIETIVNSPETLEIFHSLKSVSEDIRKVFREINNQVQPISKEFSETLTGYRTLAKNVDRQVEPLSSKLNEAIQRMSEVSSQADKTLKAIEHLVGKNSVVTVELTTALKEFTSATRSIRHLADYLKRHPDALIRGKSGYNR